MSALERAGHRRAMSRLQTARVAWAVMLVASGCAKHVDPCPASRMAAGHAWNAYVAALARSRTAAIAAQHEAQARLSGDLEQRFAPIAQQAADQRHPRDSDAWSSAYRAANDDACAKDDECRAWKEANATADAALSDIAGRMPTARAALAAINGDPERAAATARAVTAHPEYPQLAQAQQLALEAYVRCKSLKSRSTAQ